MRETPMSHRARMEACLAGAAIDRPPVALWRHFPVDDQTPDGLAAATAFFQNAFDFDLIKVTPSSSFCLKDWGVEDRWAGNPEGTREYTARVIQQADDWGTLRVIAPDEGRLGDQIESLRLINQTFLSDTPVIQTIFSPMAQAKNLAGPAELISFLRQSPDALHAGLRAITETTLGFLEAAVKTGIDGIFYAIQHGQQDLLSREEFDAFCRPYDLEILKAARGLWMNMVHLHGSAVMFDAVLDYPAQIINWHDRETSPSLSEALERFNGVVCGGLRQWETMVLGTPSQVQMEAQDAIQQTGGQRFILGTGCVLPITAPYGNIRAARQSVGARL